MKYLEELKIGLISLFERHINLCELFNVKSILVEEQKMTYLTNSRGDKVGSYLVSFV